MFVNKLFLSTQIRFSKSEKIDSKTDKWKLDRALERIKIIIIFFILMNEKIIIYNF